MLTEYFTIEHEKGPHQIKEKGSKFIAYCSPATLREESELFISTLRQKYYDATHVCFACRLGEGKETFFRYSDDKEPSGTAGMPIYREIKRKNLYNIVVAVVRYFGGIKLGTGGLSRAYGAAAREIIEKSEMVKKQIIKKTSFTAPYHYIGEVTALVNQMKMNIISQSYTQEAVIFTIEAPISMYDNFISSLLDRTGGTIKIEKT